MDDNKREVVSFVKSFYQIEQNFITVIRDFTRNMSAMSVLHEMCIMQQIKRLDFRSLIIYEYEISTVSLPRGSYMLFDKLKSSRFIGRMIKSSCTITKFF